MAKRLSGVDADVELRWANSDLDNAERWLQKRTDLTRIPLTLSRAISWAISAWVRSRGIEPGPSVFDTYKHFDKAAGDVLRRRYRDYSRKWMMLEYRLLGDPDDIVDQISAEQWLPLAGQAAADARKLVEAIEADARKASR